MAENVWIEDDATAEVRYADYDAVVNWHYRLRSVVVVARLIVKAVVDERGNADTVVAQTMSDVNDY